MKSYKYMHQNGIKVMRISGAFLDTFTCDSIVYFNIA